VGKYPPRTELTEPKLIICEGPSDVAFLRALMKHRRMPDCCIRHTGDSDDSSCGGIDKFDRALLGMRSWRGFSNITDILLVADNDLSPDANFQNVRAQIERANYYEIPDGPLQKKGTNPSITVLMIPRTGESGNLESLCLEAAVAANNDLATHVDEFARQSGVSSWEEITLIGKMKLRSLMSVRCKPDPFVTLGRIWAMDPNIIPLGHATFADVGSVLDEFMS
jgi:hypothetical protein